MSKAGVEEENTAIKYENDIYNELLGWRFNI